MRSVIESEMPLIVAIQHSKSGMFSKFHFTCFEWIIHGKLFHSPSFNLKNLCAAGTEEGPILLLSKLTQSIVPVCLLCVHKRKVTDIVMTHQINTFLSVSIDGTVAGWHCSDGSCCFAYDNLLPPGEIKIVLCDSDASLAWFWTRGESASLVDLKRGTVLQKIDFVGISSFSILKKHSNFLSNPNYQQSLQSQSSHQIQPSFAIMVGVNTVRTYQIDEKTNFLKCKKVDEILFSLGQRYIVTPNGIVTVKNRFIKIFLPNLDVPIYTENITEMSDDDIISTVSWKHPESLIISSFKGFFKIYKIQIRKNDSTQRISIQNAKTFCSQECCIFSNVALNLDIGSVIFAATSFPKKSKKSKKSSVNQSTVMCLSINDQKVVKLVIPQIDKICCIPDPKSRIIIQAEQHSTTFQIFDWGSSTSIVQTSNSDNFNEGNISINSSEYKSLISKSFVGSNSVTVNQSLKSISSTSDIRNYSLFGKQLQLSQSVDFRPNSSASFYLKEGSLGSSTRPSYITAIACQNFSNLASRLQIIVGTSDGKLYFFWENNLLPYEVSDALVSPVISIVLLPMRFTKASCLVAIGKDGSFCLFKWNKMSHIYVTNFLPIVALGVIETQRLIVVQKSDNSFSVYNLKSPEPISVMLIPPPRTVFIWSKVNFSQPAGIQSTLSIEISGSSLFYSVLEVSKLKKFKNQKKNYSNKIPLPKKDAVEMSPLVSQDFQKSPVSQKMTSIRKALSKPAISKKIVNSDSKSSPISNISMENAISKGLVNSNSTNFYVKSKTKEDAKFLEKTEPKANSNPELSSIENLDKKDINLANLSVKVSENKEESNSKPALSSIENLDKKDINLANMSVKVAENREESNSKPEIKSIENLDKKAANLANLSIKVSENKEESNSKPGVKSTTSKSDENLADKKTDSDKMNSILVAKSDTITKSGSNSNIYSEYTSLIRKVNTDSNSDSMPNSDSATDFYSNASPVTQNTEIPTGTIITDPVLIMNENESKTETMNKESVSNNDNSENYINELLPLREPVASENFDDSLVNLSLRNVNTGTESFQASNKEQEFDVTRSKNIITAKDENINNNNNGPIIRSGRFTSTGLKNMVSVLLEMMVPSTSNTETIEEMRTKSANFSPGMIENSKRFNSIESTQDGLSFVLVGHKNRPTFFYPMFKLSGPTVFDTSPFNAALHYLSYKIMSNFLNLIRNTEKFEKENKFKICGFISILTQLLFINDLEIQKISALTCDRIVNWSSSGIVVPEHVWNLLVASYIQYFDKNDVADYDKFLMAIMMVTHADLVDPIYHNIVFDFLKKTAKEKSPSNFLAFNILLANFDFWTEFLGGDENKNKPKNNDDNEINNNNENKNSSFNNKKGKKELMIFLINSFFKYESEEKKLVIEKLCFVIKENFNSFCESIRFILSNNPNQNIAAQICEICSDLVDEHPTSIGSLGPLFIAYLADSFSQFQEVFYRNLKLMQAKFKCQIVFLDQIWIFASNDGFIHVFKNMKLFFKEKISDGPILVVSIGPNAAFAAAVTKNDPTLVKIDLKSSFFLSLNKKRIVERNRIDISGGIKFENLKITWDNKDSCHIEYY